MTISLPFVRDEANHLCLDYHGCLERFETGDLLGGSLKSELSRVLRHASPHLVYVLAHSGLIEEDFMSKVTNNSVVAWPNQLEFSTCAFVYPMSTCGITNLTQFVDVINTYYYYYYY